MPPTFAILMIFWPCRVIFPWKKEITFTQFIKGNKLSTFCIAARIFVKVLFQNHRGRKEDAEIFQLDRDFSRLFLKTQEHQLYPRCPEFQSSLPQDPC